MERPQRFPFAAETARETFLPNQYRYLLQRINQHADDAGKMATLLFDGGGPSLLGGTLPSKFDSFLFRSVDERSFTAITDAPYFVDSKLTQGIQIADMTASVCRLYQENQLYQMLPAGGRFLSAISRYYGIIKSKTVDHITREGVTRPDIYFTPERDHYRREEERQEGLPGITIGDHFWPPIVLIFLEPTVPPGWNHS